MAIAIAYLKICSHKFMNLFFSSRSDWMRLSRSWLFSIFSLS